MRPVLEYQLRFPIKLKRFFFFVELQTRGKFKLERKLWEENITYCTSCEYLPSVFSLFESYIMPSCLLADRTKGAAHESDGKEGRRNYRSNFW